MELSLYDLRRSAAEVLAYAILELFPAASLIEGAANEFGFYYDFIAEQPVDDYALTLLEEKMRGIIKQNEPLRKLDMMRENAAALFHHKEQPFQALRISQASENIVSIFHLGHFHDYVQPPYVTHTAELEAFKLLEVEKVTTYIPDEGNLDIIRIHGTAFADKTELKKYLKAYKLGKKRDHRIIAEKAGFFSLNEEINPVAWTWLPNGILFREQLLEWWRNEHWQQNFNIVSTPSLVKKDLLQQCGLISNGTPLCSLEDVDYVIPPSFTPSHAVLFASKEHTYTNLPVRLAECGVISAEKNEGQLWGVFNSKSTLHDAAHFFCTPEQVEKELISSLQFINRTINMFSLECHWHLKGRPIKSAGTPESWKKGIECFKQAFEKSGLTYTCEEYSGMYAGPSAQLHLVDAVEREWKGPELSIDFDIPERLQLCYRTVDGKMRVPILVKRSVFGSLERFIAILIEHYGEKLVQALKPGIKLTELLSSMR